MISKISLGLAAAIAGLALATPASAECYVRGDTGYAWSGDTNAWAEVNNVSGDVTAVDFDDGWILEAGFGCARRGTTEMGGIKDAPVVVPSSRGFRADVTAGWREEREFDGTPPQAAPGDPIHTSLQDWTLMFNAYYDLGNFYGFTPYVGAGIGMAFHDLDNVTFTDPSNNTIGTIKGGNSTDFAWAVMAGVSRDIGYRGSVLDVGYRYIDMGSVEASGTICNCPAKLKFDDTAHEVRVGIRVPLSRHEEPMPMK